MRAIHEHWQHAIRGAVQIQITDTSCIYLKDRRTSIRLSLVSIVLISLCLFLAPQPAFAVGERDWSELQTITIPPWLFNHSEVRTAGARFGVNLETELLENSNTQRVWATWDPIEETVTIQGRHTKKHVGYNKGWYAYPIWDMRRSQKLFEGMPKVKKLIVKDKVHVSGASFLSSHECLKDAELVGFENCIVTYSGDLSHMFDGFTNANPDVSNWDVRYVYDMDHMFANTGKANPDLSKWKTAKAKGNYRKQACGMFENAKAARPTIAFFAQSNHEEDFPPAILDGLYYEVEDWPHYYQPYVLGADFIRIDGKNKAFYKNSYMKTFTAPLDDFVGEHSYNYRYFTAEGVVIESHIAYSLASGEGGVQFQPGAWSLYTADGMVPGSYKPNDDDLAIFSAHAFYTDLKKLEQAGMPAETLITIAPGHILQAEPIKVWQRSSSGVTKQDILSAVSESLQDGTSSTASFNVAESTVAGIENIDTSKPGIVDPAFQPRATIVFNDSVPFIDDNGNVVDEASGHPAFVLKDTIAVPIEVVPNTPLSISVKDTNGFTGSDGVFTSTVTLEHVPTHANLMSGSIYSDSDPSTPLRSFTRVSSVQLTRGERLVVTTLHVNTTDEEFAGALAAQPDNPKNFKLQVTIGDVSDPGQVTRAFTTSFTQAEGSQDASAYVEQPNMAATHADTPLELNFAIPPDAEGLHFDIGLERPLRELTAVQDAPDSPWNMLMIVIAGTTVVGLFSLLAASRLRRRF